MNKHTIQITVTTNLDEEDNNMTDVHPMELSKNQSQQDINTLALVTFSSQELIDELCRRYGGNLECADSKPPYELQVGDKVHYTGEYEEACGNEDFNTNEVYTVVEVDTGMTVLREHEGTTTTIVVEDENGYPMVYMMAKNFKLINDEDK